MRYAVTENCAWGASDVQTQLVAPAEPCRAHPGIGRAVWRRRPRRHAGPSAPTAWRPADPSEGGKIYLSEAGRESELRLGATPERDRLLRLLEEHGAAGVKLDPTPASSCPAAAAADFPGGDKEVADR